MGTYIEVQAKRILDLYADGLKSKQLCMIASTITWHLMKQGAPVTTAKRGLALCCIFVICLESVGCWILISLAQTYKLHLDLQVFCYSVGCKGSISLKKIAHRNQL